MLRSVSLKLLVCSIAAASWLGSVTPASSAEAAAFQDITGHWGKPAIDWAVQSGVVDGYDDGTFRPDTVVSEPEFLAMLMRAYPGLGVAAGTGAAWYAPYYTFAQSKGWPVQNNVNRNAYNRGHVALTIAGTQKGALPLGDSIRYLLDNGLSQGKTAATVDGYQAADPLSRAEAVQFIRNLRDKKFALSGTGGAGSGTGSGSSVPTAAAERSLSVKGLAIGDPASALSDKLGTAARIDASEYGFDWYVYNADYADYIQIGVHDGKIVALYSGADNWKTLSGVKDGTSKNDVLEQYGQPVPYILKGNTRYQQNYGKGEYGTYESKGSYVTFFYDLFDEGKVTAVQAIEKQTELALPGYYGKESAALIEAYEHQSFDLANAQRAKMGLPAFAWAGDVASTARRHSKDMAVSAFFDHTNLKGLSPFDRMKADGISYGAAAENISAGQSSAIFAHHGWMNSEGHRRNLLGDYDRLGTGVAFGGKMSVYYTQNFYSPMKK
jgi:uncharacterized protein YkwD